MFHLHSSFTVQANSRKGLIWAFGSVTSAIVAGRLYIHWRYSTRRRSDHILNILAYLSLVPVLAIAQVEFFKLGVGVQDLHLSIPGNVLVWTTLYFVKASFMALYWTIFKVSPGFRIIWWITAVYTFLTFLAIILSYFWQCGNPLKVADPETCATALSDGTMQRWVVGAAAVSLSLHISSECLILGLPAIMVWNLNMPSDKKMGIAGVCAVTIIDIILGVIRNAAALTQGLEPNNETTVYIANVLSICEPCIAVIVCAMPAYRVLLPSSRKRNHREEVLLRNVAKAGEAAPYLPSRSLEEGKDRENERSARTIL